MSPRPSLAALLLLALSALRAAGAGASGLETGPAEDFEYRWTLGGFKGVMARLFIPGQGEGRLTMAPGPDDQLITELRISSREGERDEFWLYGAEIDPAGKRTVRAWSAQRFRGESKRKERQADGIDALDLASSIYYLRQELPVEAREAMIWSSGQLKPVVIQPLGRGTAEWRGESVGTRGYTIRGVPKPGRQTWRGRMDLVLVDDEKAVPLEIVVVRKGMRIRLELVDDDGDA